MIDAHSMSSNGIKIKNLGVINAITDEIIATIREIGDLFSVMFIISG